MGKAQKLGFLWFSEQILPKFVLYAIYVDESHEAQTYHNHIHVSIEFGQKNDENP